MRICPLPIAVCTGIVGCWASFAGGEPQPGDFARPRVVVPAPKDSRYAHLGWPKIVKAKDGTLVLAYIAARKHTAGGCPAVSISKDKGKTFSQPRILRTFGEGKDYRHSGNLAVGVAEDGAVVLLAMAFSGNTRTSVFGWRSDDCGRTWDRADASSLADNRTGSVYGRIFPVPRSGLAVFGHYRKPKGDGIWVAYSKDHGKTWGEPKTITTKRLFEPCFAFAQGRLIGLIRKDSDCVYHQYVSDDLGKTWAPPRLVLGGDDSAGHPSPFIATDPADASRLLALQSQRTRRGEVYLWSAGAKTLNWRRLGLVVTFPGCEDYSYPWMVHLDDNAWFLVFYAGEKNGANSIYGMRLEVPSS